MIDLEPSSGGGAVPESRPRYVLALDSTDSFAIFGPGRTLLASTNRIDRASHFDSMSEATMSGYLAGLDDFTVQLHQQS